MRYVCLQPTYERNSWNKNYRYKRTPSPGPGPLYGEIYTVSNDEKIKAKNKIRKKGGSRHENTD